MFLTFVAGVCRIYCPQSNAWLIEFVNSYTLLRNSLILMCPWTDLASMNIFVSCPTKAVAVFGSCLFVKILRSFKYPHQIWISHKKVQPSYFGILWIFSQMSRPTTIWVRLNKSFNNTVYNFYIRIKNLSISYIKG